MNKDFKQVKNLIKNLDEQVRQYIYHLGDSNLCWELIKFYHYNPYSLFTLERLSIVLGRDIKDVEKSASELFDKKILDKIHQGEELPEVYSYAPTDLNHNYIEIFLETIRKSGFSPKEAISYFFNEKNK